MQIRTGEPQDLFIPEKMLVRQVEHGGHAEHYYTLTICMAYQVVKEDN